MRAQDHRAVVDAAAQGDRVALAVARQPVRAARIHPELVPLPRLLVVSVEAAAAAPRGAFPLLAGHAAAVALGDAVLAEQLARRVAHVPVAEPEVELAVLRRRARRQLRHDRL